MLSKYDRAEIANKLDSVMSALVTAAYTSTLSIPVRKALAERAQYHAKIVLDMLTPKTDGAPGVGEILEDVLQAIARGNTNNPTGMMNEALIMLSQNAVEAGECANDRIAEL